ncbi:MaoC family dehydratase [Pseudomonas sp. Marseille-QA0892]
MTQWLDMPAPPALPVMYLQAALRRGITGRVLPDRGLRCTLDVDPTHLARYRELCGHVDDGALPPAYPHVLAFPLQMHLLTANDFPFPLLGLVHLENRIRVLRPLDTQGPLRVSVIAENLQAHPRGAAFDLIARLEDEQGALWEGVSRLLCRGASVGEAERERRQRRSAPLREIARWSVPADIGRAYARVSGDYNPIHLSPLTARLFGFDRPIAHGLWNKARVLAAMADRLPRAGYEVEACFHRPLVLPGEALLMAGEAGESGHFAVTGAKGKRHLDGSWRPLPLELFEPEPELALAAQS